MKKKIANWKLGIILFAFVAVCAKFAKATWYDVTSKLSVFQKADKDKVQNENNPCDFAAACEDPSS